MKYPMTLGGQRAIKAELDHLKKVERISIVNEIEVARAHGDLRENAEYHAAKEKQGMIEAKIKHLETRLTHAEVIDVSELSGEKVLFGATVTIFDVDTEEEKTYQIVGDEEADLNKGKISYASPIAKALIGKSVDDEVQIRTPKGTRTVEITEVRFA